MPNDDPGTSGQQPQHQLARIPQEAARSLTNLGNTSFMNSVLQCLAHCEISDYFTSGRYETDLEPRAAQRTSVTALFAHVLREMWSGYALGSYAPVELHEHLKICASSLFAEGNVRDAQEFYLALIRILRVELNQRRSFSSVRSFFYYPLRIRQRFTSRGPDQTRTAAFAWRHNFLNERSEIVDTFAGQHQKTLTCARCQKVMVTFAVFWDITLSLPVNDEPTTLDDLLLAHYSDKIVDQTEDCSKCSRKSLWTSRLSLHRLPSVLVICLRRYVVDPDDDDQLNTLVEFPIRKLDLRPLLHAHVGESVSCLYDLIGVVNYHGPEKEGHYSSVCYNSDLDKWFSYDDEETTVMDESQIVHRNAFMLFYKMYMTTDAADKGDDESKQVDTASTSSEKA